MERSIWWNFDKRVCEEKFIGPFGEMLAWYLLRQIVVVHPIPLAEQDDPLQLASSTALAARTDEDKILVLSCLPVEMIDQIFEMLDALGDIISLCATSRQFWNIGRRRIQTILECNLNRSSWAGDRIVYNTGPMNLVDDPFPQGMLTIEEKKTFDEDLYYDDFDKRYFSPARKPLGYNRYRKDFTARFSEKENLIVNRLITVWPAQSESLDNYVYLGDLPPLETQVLRNLTRRLYVRGDTLFKFIEEHPGRLEVRNWSLGQIVAMRIDWFSDGSAPVPDDDGIQCQPGDGVWAGNQFDIQRVDHFDPNAGGEEWKDVSDAVTAIWKEDLLEFFGH